MRDSWDLSACSKLNIRPIIFRQILLDHEGPQLCIFSIGSDNFFGYISGSSEIGDTIIYRWILTLPSKEELDALMSGASTIASCFDDKYHLLVVDMHEIFEEDSECSIVNVWKIERSKIDASNLPEDGVFLPPSGFNTLFMIQ